VSLLVDSHCHLDFPEFADDLDGVMARAAAAGVGMCVTICTRLSTFDSVLAVAERFDNVYCSVGVHPHEAAGEGQQAADRLIELAAHPKVVGIGETGLDFYYDRSPRDRQAASFRAHIDAARETGLPLIVHARDADAETAAILAEEMVNGVYTGLMHCFSSGKQLSDNAVKLGLYISFSGIATFKTAEALRAIARDVPLDRLLVETDAPFLAPVPHRGRRNEPAFVADTAAVVADLQGLPRDALAAATTDNFFRLFTRADRARLRAA
jgi:TatD DNase family protein